jgi:hypothetical protein
MDFEEHLGKDTDHQQGMKTLKFVGLCQPGDKLCHEPWRVEGRSGLEHNADLLP